MCGIAGVFSFHESKTREHKNPQKVLNLLRHRGPDFQSQMNYPRCQLFHSRLSIVDTSSNSNQPYSDGSKNQCLVYNGEVFNFKTLSKNLPILSTNGDVEVVYKLLQQHGENCLNLLNGFFAFGYYDQVQHRLLLARDRYGVKPLYYFVDEGCFAFASELKPLLELCGKQELNHEAIYSYFRLNYSAGRETVFKKVFKLLPGEVIEVKNGKVTVSNWYKAPTCKSDQNLRELLTDAVNIRLNADVPVGTFLSGGLDSSIISALAIKHKPDLNTFSIGFEKESYFDETYYSELVAKHIGSNHHVLKLKEDDFIHEIPAFLKSIDEPFADSSAFNFYMLSKYTAKHVKVALSGDGADELFKGYNKHKALFLSKRASYQFLGKYVAPLFSGLASSRHGSFQNKLRQFNKFSELVGKSEIEKQMFLASISNHTQTSDLLKPLCDTAYFEHLFQVEERFSNFSFEDSFDLQTVLADDMLVKADRFSMQHGLEIRNPFLDYRIVEYALNLDPAQKINADCQKCILKSEFKDVLPPSVFNRSKKGFELPLQAWLSNNLRSSLDSNWLQKEKLEHQNIINVSALQSLRQGVQSNNAGDSAARLWAVIVFEAWLDNFSNYTTSYA